LSCKESSALEASYDFPILRSQDSSNTYEVIPTYSYAISKNKACRTTLKCQDASVTYDELHSGMTIPMEDNIAYRAMKDEPRSVSRTGRHKSVIVKKNEAYRALNGTEKSVKMKKNEAYRALRDTEDSVKVEKNETHQALTNRVKYVKKNDASRGLEPKIVQRTDECQ